MNTTKNSKNSQFNKLDDNKEWVDFKSCSTNKWVLQTRSSIHLLGYTQIIYVFFFLKNIWSKNRHRLLFSHLICLDYKTFLRYYNEVWRWKIMLISFCPYPKMELGVLKGLTLAFPLLSSVPAHNILSEKLNILYFNKTTWLLGGYWVKWPEFGQTRGKNI